MADPKKTARKTSPEQPPRDIFLTVLSATDGESLVRMLQKETLDVGPMQTRPDSKEVEVHLYLDEEQIKRLKKHGWKLDVRENLSENGRQRQKEVGKGDRFKGGSIPPKGLGEKIREEG